MTDSCRPVIDLARELRHSVAGGVDGTQLGSVRSSGGDLAGPGIDLLVGQALDQIRLMTGRSCPPEPLLDAAYAALGGRG